MRVGIVREYMVKHAANDARDERSRQRGNQQVLRDRLGAELMESVDPLYPDDPSIPNMTLQLPAGARGDPAVPYARVPAAPRRGRDTLLYAVPKDSTYDHARVHGEGCAKGRRRCPTRLNIRSVNVGPPSAELRVQSRAVPAAARRRARQGLGHASTPTPRITARSAWRR